MHGTLDTLSNRAAVEAASPPLAACRLPLAACRLPLAACRLPLTAYRLAGLVGLRAVAWSDTALYFGAKPEEWISVLSLSVERPAQSQS